MPWCGVAEQMLLGPKGILKLVKIAWKWWFLGGFLIISQWIRRFMKRDIYTRKLNVRMHLNRHVTHMYRCRWRGQKATWTKGYTTFLDVLRNNSVGIARIEKHKMYARRFRMCSIEWYMSVRVRPKAGVAVVPQSFFSLQGIRTKARHPNQLHSRRWTVRVCPLDSYNILV